MITIRRIDARTDDVFAALAELRERLSPRGDIVSERGRQKTIDVFGSPLTPAQVVARICDDVREQGITAVLRYGQALDSAALDAGSLRVPAQALTDAHRRTAPEFLATMRRIRDNILQFQRALLLRDVEVRPAPGVVLRQRYLPLRRVGICVPGGAAAYPSTVLMTATLARAAGVDEIAIVAPPTEFGAYNADVLATCHELGVSEVYRMGGAQAVAALAYGMEGVPRVDKIVGPGNMFVALAKRFVFGEVDIDSIAGPSEVVVIADETTRPDFAAADLLAQAEHAPGASIFITWIPETLETTERELDRQVSKLARESETIQSLADFGALILVRDADEACRVTDWIAPEHLHIATREPESLLPRIRNAGATFLGNHTPVAIGDYVAGPSHVLPTGGTARWASGLTANDFLRGGSVIAYQPDALAHAAADIRRMADKEGLGAHSASVDIRL